MKILNGGKLQSTDSILYNIPQATKSKFTGLYITNPESSGVTLSYIINVVLISGKVLEQAQGSLEPGEMAKLFKEDDNITLVHGEKLMGRCNETTDILNYIVYGEDQPITS